MQHQSSKSVCVIDPVADPRWLSFISSHSHAGIFHHPAWLALLRDCYKWKTYALCIEQDGNLVAGIPFCEVGTVGLRRKKLVCLPFSDHCAPLAFTPEDSKYLLDRAMAHATSLRARLEIRHSLDGESGYEQSKKYCLHVSGVELEPERLMKRLKARVQRSIRNAQKSNLKTEIRRDTGAVEIFYRLHLNTRRRQGVPIQPRRFFALFHRYIIGGGLGFISLTRSGALYISAGVFCEFNGTLTYKYGASDPAYLYASPNHLMFWDTMVHARQEGFSRFDLGKKDLSNSGLRFFKGGWNSTETELPYSYFTTAPSSGLLELLNKKLIEPTIKKSPAIVCRLAGEGLYKYFGT
jgi:lipid II:glycine glycyltransferase (peptidoglycan interpeptide bridge formation enzyme)